MQLVSPAFHHQQRIPSKHAREGENLSPPLQWRDLPEGAEQLAIIVDDPDAPREQPLVHWVVFAIPPELDGLPAALPDEPQINDLGGVAQGTNDFDHIGYAGPAPPEGSGPHRYRFELFALDRPLQTEPKVDEKALRAAMQGKILDRSVLIGLYDNPPDRTTGPGLS